ncbi:Uncharacterised protein [Mycobacteroides abscessus subsp. abscessus]|nr:Uncharacterised protein [Mycobacteroides abscessus subsp. abscessus]
MVFASHPCPDSHSLDLVRSSYPRVSSEALKASAARASRTSAHDWPDGEMPSVSVAMVLPSADISMIRSNSASWLGPGRWEMSASASHAVGRSGSNPAAVRSDCHGPLRKVATCRRAVRGIAPTDASTPSLNSSNSG